MPANDIAFATARQGRCYERDRQTYYDKIQQARDLDDDLTYWLKYVCQGVVGTLYRLYCAGRKAGMSSAGRGRELWRSCWAASPIISAT